MHRPLNEKITKPNSLTAEAQQARGTSLTMLLTGGRGKPSNPCRKMVRADGGEQFRDDAEV
jgi:hypothetical protein